MSTKKFTRIWTVIIALVAVLAIVATFVLTGPLYTVMNMYFGKGDAVVKKNPEAEALDAEYYKAEHTDADSLLAASQEMAEKVESEGIVLLKNENQTLPLSSSETNISMFGRTSVDPIYTGAGSAATESKPVDYKTAMEANGFSINQDLFDFYANHEISTKTIKVSMQTGMGPQEVEYTGRGFISSMGTALFTGDIIAEVPLADYPSSLEDTYVKYGDAAIVFIGRVGGEGCDLPTNMSEFTDVAEDKDKTYLELDSREIDMLNYVKAQKDAGAIKKIVVVLNTANALEIDFLNDASYGIDAALWVSCIGDQGANAVAKALNGTVNPSGRTVDTYVTDLTKDPSYVNFENIYYSNVDGGIGGYESGCFNEYEEGIYVGYRYYETAAAEAMDGNYAGFDYDSAVVYPFGYGLSYTTFEKTYEGTPTYNNGTYTFNVKVTNTGDKAGKDVVEIYAEAPYTKGGIEKSKVVLAGFAKTSELEPGASETVTITVADEDIASYDYKNNKCYVLDAGTYGFYLSDNAHSWATIDKADAGKFFSNELAGEVFGADNKRDSDQVAATNQFDEVSAEFVDTKTEGKPLNFSRSDFAGTFPTAPTEADIAAEDYIKTALETVFDENTNEKTGNVEGSLVYTDQMPVTGADNGIQLVNMRGLSYDDPAWEQLLDELDMDGVANMLANAGYNTAELLNIGKPATLDYDGPMGWSTWVSANGADAICIGFPAEELLAATWNVDLAKEVGEIVGEQGLFNGFNGWYAPAMNTHRNAFAGRNYEYYSEDGLLGGKIAAGEISGTMKYGVYTYIKHFAVNDKENGRNGIATWLNEQALREIYLRPFEVAVKEAKADVNYYDENNQLQTTTIGATTAIMSAYNRIGTVWAGAQYGLQTQILRNEWGFRGAVESDYFGGSAYMDPDSGLRAGNDLMLNTFADGGLSDKSTATGVNAMRNAAHNVLYMVANSNAMQGIVSGTTVSYKMAGWQKALLAGDIVAALIICLGITLIVKKKKAAKEA
ncbi:glycoside hydrolase family 3 C-terminal domain-containing protein [Butyrivibrio sp. INlla16]|uniref:glycoside hydrolase family 3 C-terminal domain-containing protein n=1 Tax=Butyrivibrio sp. INlla16 TaxID=1520807 RepID=UPI00087F58DB|nr:glycoside hydrolase family 3 C-terminal domain-containing protein [Butyrivibrio sp. INlla16]SDB34064.1 beta-glucosidase [Butyrivibrio sp. INlla16]